MRRIGRRASELDGVAVTLELAFSVPVSALDEIGPRERRALEYTVTLALRLLDSEGQQAFMAEWKTGYIQERFA